MSEETGVGFAAHANERECQLSCQHGGYCTFASHNSAQLLSAFVNGALIERCVCPPGFTGLTCENTSEHGGTLGSDCSEADKVSAFAGAMCREPATSYCGSEGIENRGFCTNGGLCGAYLRGSGLSSHPGCQCPPEFTGPHCEYLRATPASDEEVHEKSFMEQAIPDAPEAAPPVPLEQLFAERTVPADPAVASHAKPQFRAKTIMAPVPPAQPSNASAPDNGVFLHVGLAACISLSIFGAALLAYQVRRAKRGRRDGLLRRDRYAVEPIRAKVYGELESPGVFDGYYDEEDDRYSPTERSECSLEEIELEGNPLANNYREYLQNIRDGGYREYFGKGAERHDFSSIIGPIVNSKDRDIS